MDEKTTQAICTLIEVMTMQHRETMQQLQSIVELCEAHADNLVDVAAAAGVDPAVAV